MSSQQLHRPTTRSPSSPNACAHDLHQLAGTPTWTMCPEQQRQALSDLAQAEAQRPPSRRVRPRSGRTPGATRPRAAHAAATVVDWVAVETRQTRIAARCDLDSPRHSGTTQPLPARALGRPTFPGPRVIIKALDRLPTTVTHHPNDKAASTAGRDGRPNAVKSSGTTTGKTLDFAHGLEAA